MKTIRENIKKYRKERGYSQEKLEELADIGQKSLSLYETGKRTASIETLVKLANALDISLDTLCGRDREKGNAADEMLERIRNVLEDFVIEKK